MSIDLQSDKIINGSTRLYNQPITLSWFTADPEWTSLTFPNPVYYFDIEFNNQVEELYQSWNDTMNQNWSMNFEDDSTIYGDIILASTTTQATIKNLKLNIKYENNAYICTFTGDAYNNNNTQIGTLKLTGESSLVSSQPIKIRSYFNNQALFYTSVMNSIDFSTTPALIYMKDLTYNLTQFVTVTSDEFHDNKAIFNTPAFFCQGTLLNKIVPNNFYSIPAIGVGLKCRPNGVIDIYNGGQASNDFIAVVLCCHTDSSTSPYTLTWTVKSLYDGDNSYTNGDRCYLLGFVPNPNGVTGNITSYTGTVNTDNSSISHGGRPSNTWVIMKQ